MEETLQEENKKSEYKNPNEDEGGIRRRLRDRDLLRKRKAEAEEKETNQVESQRKRSRTDEKGGAKRRGRPRKMDPIQAETAVGQQAPAVVVVPEPLGIISGQTSGPLTSLVSVAGDTLESRPSSIPAAPTSVPVFGSLQRSFPAPVLTPPDPVNQTPTPVLPLVAAPSIADIIDKAQVPFQDSIPVPVPALSQVPVPTAALDLPQVGTQYTESEDKEALNQVLIDDVGPEEEEDIKPSQDKSADEDFSERPLVNIPEENKMFSIPTLSSSTLPQEYLPGNSI